MKSAQIIFYYQGQFTMEADLKYFLLGGASRMCTKNNATYQMNNTFRSYARIEENGEIPVVAYAYLKEEHSDKNLHFLREAGIFEALGIKDPDSLVNKAIVLHTKDSRKNILTRPIYLAFVDKGQVTTHIKDVINKDAGLHNKVIDILYHKFKDSCLNETTILDILENSPYYKNKNINFEEVRTKIAEIEEKEDVYTTIEYTENKIKATGQAPRP